MTTLEQSILPYLEHPLENTTFGQALKGILRFRQEVVFDWVKADDIMLSVDCEYADAKRASGFFGMLGITHQGPPEHIVVTLDRVLSSVANDNEDPDAFDDEESKTLSLVLGYDISALDGFELQDLDGEYFDSCDYANVEDYVKAVLEHGWLQKIAALRPKFVELSAEED